MIILEIFHFVNSYTSVYEYTKGTQMYDVVDTVFSLLLL